MNNATDLKAMERKLYWSYHNDGFTDMALGVTFLWFGLMILTDNPGLSGIIGVWIVILALVKKQILAPRIGRVQFSPSRKKNEFLLGLAGVLLGLVAFMLFSFSGSGSTFSEMIRHYYPLILGVFLALLPVTVGFMTGLRRFYGYGALLFIVFAIEQWYPGHLGWSLFSYGALCTLSGLLLLVRFLKQHPKQEMEAGHVE